MLPLLGAPLLQQLIELIPQAVWVADNRAAVIQVNSLWQRYTGLAVADTLGEHIWQFFHADDRSALEAAWHNGISLQQSWQKRARLQMADASCEWFDIAVQPLAASIMGSEETSATVPWFGTISRLAKITSGVHLLAEQGFSTDHRQTAAALRLSEQRFQSIFYQTFQFIGLLSPDGIMVEVNQTALDFAGLTAADVLNRSFWEIPWWPSSAAQQQLQQAIERAAAGEFVRYEVEVLDAAGQLVPIDFSLNPVRDDHGQVALIIPEGRDIAARKQLENELRVSKSELETRVAERTAELAEREIQFRTTFEQAAIGCCHVALDGRWLRMNQKLCTIVGYTHEELRQKTFQDITHPEDLAEDLAYVEQLLAGDIPHYSLEKRYIRGDGSIVWTRITVSLRRRAALPGNCLGEPIYFIVMIEDISDRKQLEFQDAVNRQALEKTKQSLEKRNRELDQFVHIASHDLKAPLRGIANLSEWLEEDLAKQLSPEHQVHLELMRTRVKRMENLINGLLEYSRVGREAVEQQWVDTRELLLEIVDSLDPPETFQIRLPEIMPQFQTRGLLLSQVFANLLSNAVKHHHQDSGRVVVDWAEQEEYYLFSVTDDGPGIPLAQQERVFGIFQTINDHESSSNTGIGLALIKKIVEDGGGSIHLQSVTGRGCRFEFTWPKQSCDWPRSAK
jgi:PAS domain S-box-containing protein